MHFFRHHRIFGRFASDGGFRYTSRDSSLPCKKADFISIEFRDQPLDEVIINISLMNSLLPVGESASTGVFSWNPLATYRAFSANSPRSPIFSVHTHLPVIDCRPSSEISSNASKSSHFLISSNFAESNLALSEKHTCSTVSSISADN